MINYVKLKNFKCFDDLHLQFNNSIVYLTGYNGSGKSTIVEGIQLALLGYIPGHSKKLSDIFKFSSNNYEMKVEVGYTINEQTYTISRIYKNTNRKISCNVDKSDISDIQLNFDANLEVPVFNFNEFLQWSSNKQKQWLLDFLQKSDEKVIIDWFDEINKLIKENNIILDNDFVSELLDELSNNCITSDLLKEYNTLIKDRISEERLIINSSEKSLQETELNLADMSNSTSSNMEELSTKLYKLTEKISQFNYHKKVVEQNKTIQNELEKYSDLSDNIDQDKIYANTLDEYTKCKQVVSNISDDIKSKSVEKSSIDDKINSINSAVTTCPILNEECKELIKNKTELDSKLNELYLKQSALSEDLKNLQDELDIELHQIEKHKLKLREIKDKYLDRDALKLSILSVPNSDTFVDSDETSYMVELESKRDELGKQLHDSIEYNSLKTLSEKLEKQLYVHKNRLDLLKVLDKYTGPNGLQSKLESSNIKKFLDKMSENSMILYNNYKCYFDIENEKSNSFDFGLIQNDRKISYGTLSSGEKCIYMIMLLSNIIENSNTCKLLIIDDIFDHLDSENIKKVIDFSRNNSKIQYIFAGYQDISNIESLNKYVVNVNQLHLE